MISSGFMSTEEIVRLLVAERERIDRAIEALQGPKRRGRPPKSAIGAAAASMEEEESVSSPRKKRTFSKAQREAAAERMRKYWATKRKQG